MKKILRSFAIAVAMLLPMMASAQNTLTVADGTTTNSNVPIHGLWADAYLRCQTIYPAADIEAAASNYLMTGGSITSVTYYLSSPASAAWSGTWEVKIMEVTATTLSAFVDMTSATTVYTGTLDGTTSPMTITFTTPYTYQGGNLLIEVNQTASGNYKSCSFYGVTSTNASWQGYNSSSWAGITGSAKNFIPKTTFTFTGGTEITCFPVTNLDFDATQTTTSSVTLTWNDTINTGATYTVYDMADSSVVASGLTATTYTVSGLDANTPYTFGVEPNCSATDAGVMSTIAVRTACGITPVPYSTDFNEFATGQMPFCWDVADTGHTSSNTFPCAYNYSSNAHSGPVYFEFETSNGDVETAVLPEFDTPISSLQMNFWACATNTANFVFEVGVVESGNFVVYDTVAITQSSSFSSSNYHYYQVFFNEYTGTGDRIALRVTPAGTATSYTFFMDDIEVTEFGGCFPIENLAVSNIGSSSVTLTWHDASNSGATYTVYDMADTSVVETAINDTTVTITNLTPNTQYTLAVVADCSSLGESDAVTASFRTTCAPMPIPFTETFDATLGSDPCWRGASGTTAAQVFSGTTLTLSSINWSYASSVRDGLDAGHYYMNIYGTSCKSWMITPQIDLSTASSPLLTFSAAFTKWNAATPAEGNIDDDKFLVIISTDGGNTWDSTNAISISLTSLIGTAYTTQYVDLSNYAGDTIKIAFYAESTVSGGDNDLHIDNITVEESTGEICYPPTNLTVSGITSTGATLSWDGNATSYTIVDMSDSSDVATVSDSTYEFTTLTPMTHYTFGVFAVCSSDNSDTVVVSFSTACDALTLPYTETFESSSNARDCWSTDGPGSWSFGAGDYSTSTGAFEGTTNAKITHSSSGNVTKLISPAFNGGENGITLTFAHVQRSWGGDIDELRVYSRASDTGAWQQVAEYTNAYSTWTVEQISITTPVYQIAFEMTDSYGYGVGIDSVVFSAGADQPVLDSFTVVLGVNDTAMGTITPAPGSYVFHLGDTATATAVANPGYHFVMWLQQVGSFTDTTIDNPASHVIDTTMLGLTMTMTAIFEADSTPVVLDSFTVVLGVNDTAMGTITPAPGTYVFQLGDTATATAVANPGYHFVMWLQQVGSFTDTTIANPASHVIDSTLLGLSMTMTAIFAADSTPDTTNYYTLTVDYDTNMGMVMYMEGPYEAGDSAFVMAFANPGYRFVSYTEGATVVSTDAIYEFVMTGNLTLTANFEADTTASLDSLTIITGVNDPTMGTVTPAPGIHRYAEGDVFTVTATPNSGYFFGGWIISVDYGFFTYNDTLVGAPATYSDTVTEDYLGMTMGFTAMFTTDSVPVVNPDSIIVTFAVNDATMGTTNPAPGTYTYADGDSIFVEATAFDGYQFVGWHVAGSYYGDAVDTTLYTTETTFGESLEDMGGLVLTVTALFASDTVGPNPTMYTVTVSVNNASLGTVSGAGTYAEGSTVTLTATPSENATFVGWLIDGDTITDNPYTFTITGHVTAVAIFVANTGIEDADMTNVSVYGAESRIVVRGAEGKDVYVYDLTGRTVASQKNATENTEFRMAHTGVYLVKVGNAAAKRVMVVR